MYIVHRTKHYASQFIQPFDVHCGTFLRNGEQLRFCKCNRTKSTSTLRHKCKIPNSVPKSLVTVRLWGRFGFILTHFVHTVKLGNKERFDKEQIGIKEQF